MVQKCRHRAHVEGGNSAAGSACDHMHGRWHGIKTADKCRAKVTGQEPISEWGVAALQTEQKEGEGRDAKVEKSGGARWVM